MMKTQTFNTVKDRIGKLKSRTVFMLIEITGNTKNPYSRPFALYCVDDSNPNNRVLVGRYGSNSSAQKAADDFVSKNRKNPPALKWE
jgi:hypothetical protein